MPCDTIQIMKVQEKLEGLDLDLLKAAMEKLGFKVGMAYSGFMFNKGDIRGSYDGTNFKWQSAYGTIDINEVKRAYSAQVVETSAEQFGWILDKTAEGEYQLEKPF